MSTFVKFCPQCRRMFRDAGAYALHEARCGKVQATKPMPKVVSSIQSQSPVSAVEPPDNGGKQVTEETQSEDSGFESIEFAEQVKRPPGRPPKPRT